MAHLTLLGTEERVDLSTCDQVEWEGATLYRDSRNRLLAPAFGGYGVALGALGESDLSAECDEEAFAERVLDWVEAVRDHDWSELRGAPLEGEGDWLDLRTAMVRVGWGPRAALGAWRAARRRPYARDLPTAAGWAGGGWVVPALGEPPEDDPPEPAFAVPVLETRGLLRWAYMTRWADPAVLPQTAPPVDVEPSEPGWVDVLARLRADHYTAAALEEAEQLAVEVLTVVGLGPRTALEAEDEPLPDRHLEAACEHASRVVRTAAWFLLRAEAETWLACAYAECQHHWAVEAEEDAFEQEEVLEMAAHGVTDPVDAAATRRRLLTMAFGDINDVPLAGAGGMDDFLAFYAGWVDHGRPEEALEEVARELRGD
ncbi:MAG: hypothetical protein ACR2MA_03705 [Egibacteraceae bacterium]